MTGPVLAVGRCAGIGLVEMMVALVIGMLVTLASAAMLVTANGDFLHHGASARVNDGGRYALELIGDRWTLLVLRELMLGGRRFSELRADLPGMGESLDVPADADRDWWEHVLIDHIRQHWHHVTERFATIVIDDDTTTRSLKRELRWNAAYHRLAEGL